VSAEMFWGAQPPSKPSSDEIVNATKNGLPWTRGKPKTDHCRVSQCDRETKSYRK
jgi:hypothetical protein